MGRISIIISAILFSIFSFNTGAYCAEPDLASLERPFMEERYDKAVSQAQRMINERCRQRDEVYYIKGASELKLSRFKGARNSFEMIISKYPRSARAFDAYIGIGDAYFLEGDMDGAVKAYNEVKEKFPSDKNIDVVNSKLDGCRKNGEPSQPAVAADENVKAAPAESIGNISVQAGCFKNRRNAESLSAKLQGKGYESYVELPVTSGDSLYRVKVGRFKSKGEAEGLAAILNRDGYKTKICE